ncbi:uncharacterized protein LOC127265848 [Andrographis paniculata]|uniref:uncharacterized protein LOC127265848 n=1 Tax=Andrographis paniculata TaxID=175694 RepID=UPI0021E918A8|nr:uncharacterized protein LOC127265848 [Andrographis paniculata]
MEAEIQELVSMGFAADLAAEALAAADGDLHRATDCLLSHTTADNPQPISWQSNSTSSPPIVQPKIDRFFNLHPKKAPKSQSSEADEDLNPRQKRQKSSENHTNHPPAANQPPLAEQMRPRVLDEVVGQDHLLSPTSLLRSAIASSRLPSVVLWGPPGAGKTSIAKAIARSAACYRFVSLSAVTAGVKDIRETVEEALKFKIRANKRTLLFIDEVHRFNKAQQDSLLPIIEDGSVTLLGATTENPSFHLITPLLSRCRVLPLNPLNPNHITLLLNRAINDTQKGLSPTLRNTFKFDLEFNFPDAAISFLSMHCDGDARVALNALEAAATTAVWRRIENDQNSIIDSVVAVVGVDDVKEALQCKHLVYDRDGDEHYNMISALHKSMRGSDADASIYWLARMLEGGEDPLYIARRLVRFASEDVGLADPQALSQAVSCYQACHFLGMPECDVVLAQCAAYLALAPKSVAVYRAIGCAREAVRVKGSNERVPLHLRNAPTKVMKELGYGKGYVYPPDNPDSAEQTYLPPSLQGSKFLHWPCPYPK